MGKRHRRRDTLTESPEFTWGDAVPEGEQTEQVVEPQVETGTSEPVAAIPDQPVQQAPVNQQPAQRLEDLFPTNRYVLFTASEFVGQYGIVLGIEDIANVAYVK